MQCNFCNIEVEEKGHIQKCAECAGETHDANGVLTCACCGKEFAKPVKVSKKASD